MKRPHGSLWRLQDCCASTCGRRARPGREERPAGPEIYTGIIVNTSRPRGEGDGTSATTMRACRSAPGSGSRPRARARSTRPSTASTRRPRLPKCAQQPRASRSIASRIRRARPGDAGDADDAERHGIRANQWTLQAPPRSSAERTCRGMAAHDRIQFRRRCVLDTGIRRGHPDLAGRLLTGYDFISSDAYAALNYPANWNAADGDGRDADRPIRVTSLTTPCWHSCRPTTACRRDELVARHARGRHHRRGKQQRGCITGVD